LSTDRLIVTVSHVPEPRDRPAIAGLGGHAALELLNTRCLPQGEEIESLPDGRALVDWLLEAKLLDPAHASVLQRRMTAAELDQCAAEARRLREWARGWIARWRVAPADDYARELTTLNRWLARATVHRQLARAEHRFRLAEVVRVESKDDVLALLAAQVAALMADEDPALVKQCTDPTCTLAFVDRTKSHRRMFCSAATCGNRAKVAAFRSRQRDA
jgi:predicted RNA-binding Zn ribbon-like protein